MVKSTRLSLKTIQSIKESNLFMVSNLFSEIFSHDIFEVFTTLFMEVVNLSWRKKVSREIILRCLNYSGKARINPSPLDDDNEEFVFHPNQRS